MQRVKLQILRDPNVSNILNLEFGSIRQCIQWLHDFGYAPLTDTRFSEWFKRHPTFKHYAPRHGEYIVHKLED